MRNACKYFNSHNYISNYQASTPFYENMRNDFVFFFSGSNLVMVFLMVTFFLVHFFIGKLV